MYLQSKRNDNLMLSSCSTTCIVTALFLINSVCAGQCIGLFTTNPDETGFSLNKAFSCGLNTSETFVTSIKNNQGVKASHRSCPLKSNNKFRGFSRTVEATVCATEVTKPKNITGNHLWLHDAIKVPTLKPRS